MSLLSLFLGVAIGVIAYPVAMAGIKWSVKRIQGNG